MRNPATQVAYAPGSEPVLFLGRGYTGHEHLAWFGLINMNARLYDPLLGRFLSPDPYVQAPNLTQNFNRYSYCLNNPLVYVDENGEFIFSLFLGPIGAIIDAALWSATIDAGIQLGKMALGMQDKFNWGQLGGAFVGGAVGGVMGAIAPAFTQSNLLVRYTTKALYAGATGIVSAGAGMLSTDLFDNGKIDISGKDYLKGMLMGGGLSMGVSLGSSAYDYATWDRLTVGEKISKLSNEFNTPIGYDKANVNDYGYFDATKSQSKFYITDKGLATRSLARTTVSHEMVHLRDFQQLAANPIRGGSRPFPGGPTYSNLTERNAYVSELLTAKKFNLSLNDWKMAVRGARYYGYTGSVNKSFDFKMLLRNIY